MADELTIVRDAKGRIVTRSGVTPGGGRPMQSEQERIRRDLIRALDPETMESFLAAVRKKIAKGNLQAAEFMMDRIIGKPAVTVSHDVEGRLGEFMAAWSAMRAAEIDGTGEDK